MYRKCFEGYVSVNNKYLTNNLRNEFLKLD